MAEKLDDKEDELTFKADFKTSVDVDDDILKCPICFEVFNKPKYLPCLHTFCEACLDSYIVSSVQQDLETKNNETESKPKVDFKCPVCRVVVPVSDQTLPVEEWASTFTTNHSLLALLDKQKLQRNVKLCDPCQMDSKDVTAKSWCKVCNEALCETCANYHRKFVATKQHKLFAITEEGGDDYKITRFEYCKMHKDRQLEAFCFDHDQPCCVSCVTINHRKCDHVSSLEDAARDVLDKPEITELKQTLNEMEKLFSKMLEITKLNMSNVHQEKQNMLTHISELRVRINTHLDEIQSKLEQDIKSSEKQHVGKLNEIIFDLENRQKQVDHYRRVLATVSAKATNVHVFLEMKKIKKKQEEIEMYLKSALKDIKLVNCTLKITEELESELFLISNFGSVDVDYKPISHRIDSVSTEFPSVSKMFQHFRLYSTSSISSGVIRDALYLPDGRISVSSG